MSDFADGIPPQRYVCRRPDTCRYISRKTFGKGQQNDTKFSSEASGRWSLDKGRWVMDTSPQMFPPPPSNELRETNPFIGFKRFVDNTWARLSSQSKVQIHAPATSNTAEQSHSRWTGQAAGAIESSNARYEAIQAARQLFRLAELRTWHIESTSIRRLFEEDQSIAGSNALAEAMLAFGGACYFLPEIGDRLPSSAALFRPPTRPPRWLSIDWFKDSPYSPVQVEASDDVPWPPGKWRRAFEELIAASLGHRLPIYDTNDCLNMEHASKCTEVPAGIDWVIELQIRGLLPPLLPNLHRSPATSERDVGSFVHVSNAHDKDFDTFVEEIWKSNRASSILEICHQEQKANPYLPTNGDGRNAYLDIHRGQPATETSSVIDSEPSWFWPTHTGKSESANNAAETTLNDRQVYNLPQKPTSALIYTARTTKSTQTKDGQVVVRTTIKDRYADGTEEEVETIHTSNNSERSV